MHNITLYCRHVLRAQDEIKMKYETSTRNTAVGGRQKEGRRGNIGSEKVLCWCLKIDEFFISISLSFPLYIAQASSFISISPLQCMSFSRPEPFSGPPSLTGQSPDTQGTAFKPLHSVPTSLSQVIFAVIHAQMLCSYQIMTHLSSN